MRIQLFPLHTVLAPGIALPIHVFEERYRRMVRRCLDASEPFGIVLIHRGSEAAPHPSGDDAPSLAGMGTFAEIREADLLPDGRWNLLVVGSGRFRIRHVSRGPAAAWEAEVEPVADEPGDHEAEAELVARVTRRFVEYLQLLQPRDGEEVEPIDVQVEVDVDADEADEGDPDGDPDEGDDEHEDEYEDTDDDSGGPDVVELGGAAQLVEALRIPDDPSSLSFLLTGILQVEPARKQALLEAVTAEDRMRGLDELLTREIGLLGRRLAFYAPDRGDLLVSQN
jgi:Lon protease-like protein